MYVLNVFVNNVKLKIGGFKKGILFYYYMFKCVKRF